MNRILAISGSLRSQASSTAILRAMIEISPDDIEISIYDRIANLPHFNPDLDNNEALTPVIDWRNHLQEADSVIFCTPEYAHGVPGVLKNALDWIVSSGEFMHKPTAVISVSPSSSGGDKANASLVQTLKVWSNQCTMWKWLKNYLQAYLWHSSDSAIDCEKHLQELYKHMRN